MTSRPLGTRILEAFAAVFLVCLVATTAMAQDERKIAATKERIHRLINEAEELMEAGRVNQAEKLMAEARALKKKLGQANDRRKRGDDDYHGVFRHLKEAIGALQELGRKEEAKKLGAFTEQLYKDLQRRRSGRERERDEREHDHVAEGKKHLQILGYAKAAFAEAGKKDALDMIERTMHALEMQLAGRRDREARQIIERAPGHEDIIELLGWASKILAEYGAEEKALAVRRLAGEAERRHRERERGQPRREREQPRRKREGENSERQEARRQVRVMKLAAGVLDRAGRGEAAELMEHGAHALQLRLEGARTDRAQKIYKTAPSREHLAKLMGAAAEILQDKGQRDRAEMVAKLARQYAGQRDRKRGEREREHEGRREREREGRREREREGRREQPRRQRTDIEQRMEGLAERLEHMARMLEELQAEIQQLKRRRSR
ncbi:MAG: hypothetical protein ACYTGW_08835 [Planctomycetota bacterium]|jgi:hypothetical protein